MTTSIKNQTVKNDIDSRASVIERKKAAEAAAADAFLKYQAAMKAAQEIGKNVQLPGGTTLADPVGVDPFDKAGIEEQIPELPQELLVEERTPSTVVSTDRKPVFSIAASRRAENRGFSLVQLPSPLPPGPGKDALMEEYKAVCRRHGGRYIREVYGWKIEVAEVEGCRKDLLRLGFIEVKPQREAENPTEAWAVKALSQLASEGLGFSEEDRALGENISRKCANGWKMTDGQFSAAVALARKYGSAVADTVGTEPSKAKTPSTEEKQGLTLPMGAAATAGLAVLIALTALIS